MGNQSYVDPNDVLSVLIDDNGQRIYIGEEKDIRDFNDILISRISDVFRANRQNFQPKFETHSSSNQNYFVSNALLDPVFVDDFSGSKNLDESFTYNQGTNDYSQHSLIQEQDTINNEITSIFYCKQTSIMSYKDYRGKYVEKESHEVANNFILQLQLVE